MKKEYLRLLLLFTLLFIMALLIANKNYNYTESSKKIVITEIPPKKIKKTREEAYLNTLEREQHEFNFQKNPITGKIPLKEKQRELSKAIESKINFQFKRSSNNVYSSRGPSNLGGRTRALKVDLLDNTSKTILAGGVSSGLFRTTNGGNSWVKVSPNDEIHNVTALAQDPRPGFQNIWYYATGEWSGNSASLGNSYKGQGIWQSTNSGITWTQIAATSSDFTQFDSFFDFIHNIQVSPSTGELFIAVVGRIYRYDGTNFNLEREEALNGIGFTDITIASDGTVYASLDNSDASIRGVWTSPTGNANWTRIAQNGNPTDWCSGGNARTVLTTAPSNPDILYVLYDNGVSGDIEAGLWRYDASTTTWTDFSSKLPDEPGGDSEGNDPFAIQGGYDLVVAVKPNNENFVLVGGTNAYKIQDINTESTFDRIGGYNNNLGYSLYNAGGVEHHPDIHAFEFDPFDGTNTILFTGTDGGIHKTIDIDAGTVEWQNLNNNYQTYQYYHVALDLDGSNAVLGGAQDNGTTIGGTDIDQPNNSEMLRILGGDGVAVGLAQRNTGNDYQIYAGSQSGFMDTFDSRTGWRFSIQPNGSSSQFVTYFYLDPENTNAIYYAGLSNLYVSSDAENITSLTWTNLGELPTAENIRTFATSPGAYNPSSSYLFIGGESGGLFRLADPQNAASASAAANITPLGASIVSETIVSGVAIHPTNPDIMLVVYANYGIQNIFLTTNATATTPSWTLVERNLSSHSIRSAAIADLGGETAYYVGTARGLYSSSDPRTIDWSIEGPNSIGLAVVSGLVYRNSDKKLLVGTHGNGMYETTLQTLSSKDFSENSISFKVFPNPAEDYLNLVTDLFINLDDINYKIYNIAAKLIVEGMAIQNKINVKNLNAGVYFLLIDTGKISTTTKFIKN